MRRAVRPKAIEQHRVGTREAQGHQHGLDPAFLGAEAQLELSGEIQSTGIESNAAAHQERIARLRQTPMKPQRSIRSHQYGTLGSGRAGRVSDESNLAAWARQGIAEDSAIRQSAG